MMLGDASWKGFLHTATATGHALRIILAVVLAAVAADACLCAGETLATTLAVGSGLGDGCGGSSRQEKNFGEHLEV